MTPLAGVFAALLALLDAAIGLWCVRRGRAIDALLLAGFSAAMLLVLCSQSVSLFFFAWESCAIVSVFLVAAHHERREVRRAAFVYLVFSQAGAACILVALALLARHAHSPSFGQIASAAADLPDATRYAVLGLALVGFGSKAGLLPLHFWLPRAHPVAPAHASALLSGGMLQVALYALMLVALELAAPAGSIAGIAFVAVGTVTAVGGVLYALVDRDLKRLLAYSSVENAGIVTVGLGASLLLAAGGNRSGAALALAASLFHALNHGLFKGLLFLGAGAVADAEGTVDLERLGGLWRRMRWTAPAMLVACAAGVGLPPLNGFVSEWLTFRSLLAMFALPGSAARFAALGAIAGLALAGGLAAGNVRESLRHRVSRPRASRRESGNGGRTLRSVERGAARVGGNLSAAGIGPRARVRPDRERERDARGRCAARAGDVAVATPGARTRAARVRRVFARMGSLRAHAFGRDVELRIARHRRVAIHLDGIFETAAAHLRDRARARTDANVRPRRIALVSQTHRIPHRESLFDRRSGAPVGRVDHSLRAPFPDRTERQPAPLSSLRAGRDDRRRRCGRTMIALLQIVVLVALAPLLQGAMRSLRARWQARPGPAMIQPYRDLAKHWGKETLVPEGVSPVVGAAPGIAFGVALTFAAALPWIAPGALERWVDVVALAFLLGLGRFALTLAALDTRSGFAGMAASREAAFGALIEPALLLALLSGSALGAGTGFASLSAVPASSASLLAFAAFALVVLVETARVPIDNQETHYELTMIHEGLLLEYSGRHLAMLQAAAYVKQIAFFALAALLLPGDAWWAHAGWMCALAVAITLVETALAKLRLFEVPQVLGAAFILAATSIGLHLAGGLG